MCILDELYYEWHAPREKPAEEEHEAWSRSEDLWEQVEKNLDAELFAEFQQSVIRLMDLETCREFREGFRLGAQLMLDLRLAATPSAPPAGGHNLPQGAAI